MDRGLQLCQDPMECRGQESQVKVGREREGDGAEGGSSSSSTLHPNYTGPTIPPRKRKLDNLTDQPAGLKTRSLSSDELPGSKINFFCTG